MKTLLFDLDGTLSEAREKVSSKMVLMLEKLSGHFQIGIVSGSDLDFISEQIDNKFSDHFMTELLIMPCNGTKKYQWTKAEGYRQTFDSDMINKIGKISYCDLLSRIMKEQCKFMIDSEASLDCTGKFFNYRGSMLNWSPMGRNGSKATRVKFVEFDKKSGYRKKVISSLRDFVKAHSIGVEIKLGGDTSFDIYPTGWDKTFCLNHVDSDHSEICFFGDRCFPGGNDYEIYEFLENAHHVSGPDMTLSILRNFLEGDQDV